MFSPSSPLTGATVSGLTSPTYTLTADTAPNINGKQYAVTALGGTQTGVTTHTVAKPFTISFFRPSILKVLPAANAITGVIKNISMNTYKVITRKGVNSAANNPMVARITTIIDIPAGADTYEPAELRALISAHAGALSNQASGIFDTVSTGLM